MSVPGESFVLSSISGQQTELEYDSAIEELAQFILEKSYAFYFIYFYSPLFEPAFQ